MTCKIKQGRNLGGLHCDSFHKARRFWDFRVYSKALRSLVFVQPLHNMKSGEESDDQIQLSARNSFE